MKTKSLLFGIAFLLFVSLQTRGQDNWGIGIRLGDPSGLTIKRYLGDHALELNVGRTHLWYGPYWYDKHFHHWYDHQHFDYDEYGYFGYNGSVPIAVQLHYLFQKPIGEASGEGGGGLEWYYGFGGQVRFQTFNYDYRYKPNGGPDWIYVTDERVFDIDLGTDFFIGLEYTFANAPVSLFVDANLFMEIIDNPFLFGFQAGIGGRFRF